MKKISISTVKTKYCLYFSCLYFSWYQLNIYIYIYLCLCAVIFSVKPIPTTGKAYVCLSAQKFCCFVSFEKDCIVSTIWFPHFASVQFSFQFIFIKFSWKFRTYGQSKQFSGQLRTNIFLYLLFIFKIFRNIFVFQ